MKQILKLFDYIFILRPTLFFPIWTIFLAGFFVQSKFGVAAPSNGVNNGYITSSSQMDFLWVGLFLTLLMGAVFILNQITDRVSDKKNNKLFLIAQGHISPKAALVEAVILIVPALIFGFIFSKSAAITRNMGLVFLTLFLLTGIVYSFKPFNWKDRPLLGLCANILGALLIFSSGWIIYGIPTEKMLLHACPYICAVAAVYLYTTLPDRKGDHETQKITFAVKYGFKTTIYIGCALEFLSLITAYLAQDEIIFYPAFFSMLFFVWTLIKARMEDVFRAIKFPILILALTVAIKYEVQYDSFIYFYLLFGVYFVSKIYYKLRFGLNYPSLSA
ncbi:MAG: UbiA family prenyltransferase [bacterium]